MVKGEARKRDGGGVRGYGNNYDKGEGDDWTDTARTAGVCLSVDIFLRWNSRLNEALPSDIEKQFLKYLGRVWRPPGGLQRLPGRRPGGLQRLPGRPPGPPGGLLEAIGAFRPLGRLPEAPWNPPSGPPEAILGLICEPQK